MKERKEESLKGGDEVHPAPSLAQHVNLYSKTAFFKRHLAGLPIGAVRAARSMRKSLVNQNPRYMPLGD